MGACHCKSCITREDGNSIDVPASTLSNTSILTVHLNSPTSSQGTPSKKRVLSCKTIDSLILQALSMIGKLGLVSNQDPPDALQRLHVIGDREDGWLQIICSMINVVPTEDPLGPAVITVVLDDCPLPSRDTVSRLTRLLNLSSSMSIKGRRSFRQQRNICIILGVLAEKLPAPNSAHVLLTCGTLEFLLSNLERKSDMTVALFSLIALEKFAQIGEIKTVIKNRLDKEWKHPLLRLEQYVKSDNCVEAQVGFCARWCLDNLFPAKGRKYSYVSADNSALNAMLNFRDASEYLKLSPDGLEARCDAYSFESVRCTFQVNHGVWYYEATILTSGVMQIGWATLNSFFRNHEGYGIGDDEFSISYDGCRQQLWYTACNETVDTYRPWKPGDIVGCLISVQDQYCSFYLNGVLIVKTSHLFNAAKSGFFAAASFMTFQHCRFNFGYKPFKYPPADIQFNDFNSHGSILPAEKILLPKHLQFRQIQDVKIREDACTLCFDDRASVTLNPCHHGGFCLKCSKQLSRCPVCRASVTEFVEDDGDVLIAI